MRFSREDYELIVSLPLLYNGGRTGCHLQGSACLVKSMKPTKKECYNQLRNDISSRRDYIKQRLDGSGCKLIEWVSEPENILLESEEKKDNHIYHHQQHDPPIRQKLVGAACIPIPIPISTVKR
mmetsp:Transcript_7579/g.8971  ORF Transcript_7579/g.8971 Transcript_7579/m.8971 type:complete len:124 (-) Transcript_7579:84-455(-)